MIITYQFSVRGNTAEAIEAEARKVCKEMFGDAPAVITSIEITVASAQVSVDDRYNYREHVAEVYARVRKD